MSTKRTQKSMFSMSENCARIAGSVGAMMAPPKMTSIEAASNALFTANRLGSLSLIGAL